MNGAPAGERREKLIKLASGMTFVAVGAVAVLVVITQSQTSGGDTKLEGVAEVRRLLKDLPQRGMSLGEPRARASLVEFGDLQCPVCRTYAEEALPQLIEGPVRRGNAKLKFQNFAIIGPESATAGAAALAAGAQGRGWSFVELFYRNQGGENSGYAGDEAFLTAVAKGAGVADIRRWNRDRRSQRLLNAVEATSAEAEDLGFGGTPSFAVKGQQGTLEALDGIPSAKDLEAALSAAARG